jgi:hypothetical protein
MNKVLRVYLKNSTYVEFAVNGAVLMQTILTQWKMDGVISREASGNSLVPMAVPWDSWCFAALLDVDTTGKPSEFELKTWKPN